MKLRKFWARQAGVKRTGSLTRRMIVVAAIWIALLLGVGGYALDRVLTSAGSSRL